MRFVIYHLLATVISMSAHAHLRLQLLLGLVRSHCTIGGERCTTLHLRKAQEIRVWANKSEVFNLYENFRESLFWIVECLQGLSLLRTVKREESQHFRHGNIHPRLLNLDRGVHIWRSQCTRLPQRYMDSTIRFALNKAVIASGPASV